MNNACSALKNLSVTEENARQGKSRFCLSGLTCYADAALIRNSASLSEQKARCLSSRRVTPNVDAAVFANYSSDKGMQRTTLVMRTCLMYLARLAPGTMFETSKSYAMYVVFPLAKETRSPSQTWLGAQ